MWPTDRETGLTPVGVRAVALLHEVVMTPMQPFVLLVVGFLLTSVVGGLLTYGFQRRTWRHQHEVEREEHLRERALETFAEVSTLLDRRLYRMRQLYWALKRRAKKGAPSRALEGPLTEYRAVLRDWNDNLNRNLALVEVYFGVAIRARLESGLYEEFAATGEELDQFVRDVSADDLHRSGCASCDRGLTRSGALVYTLNVLMLTCVRDGQLGGHAPRVIPAAPDCIRFGHKGARVRELQATLKAAGAPNLASDGHFGLDTEIALRRFQSAHSLLDHGVAGPATLEILSLPTPTDRTYRLPDRSAAHRQELASWRW